MNQKYCIYTLPLVTTETYQLIFFFFVLNLCRHIILKVCENSLYNQKKYFI